jgi:Recombination endonuclease VII
VFSLVETAKDARLRREYHITLDEYRRVLKFQNGCCAICKRPASGMKLALAVDHCHTTGLVRGLLCMRCNKALGWFQDNIMQLKAAAIYLEKPPVTQVLGRQIISAPGRIGTKIRAKRLQAMAKKSL